MYIAAQVRKISDIKTKVITFIINLRVDMIPFVIFDIQVQKDAEQLVFLCNLYLQLRWIY